jgi:hypothetical protein
MLASSGVDRGFDPRSVHIKDYKIGICTGGHDIAEILLKVALKTINQIKSNQIEQRVSYIMMRTS